MTATKTATAQEVIRAAAAENGWVSDGQSRWMDRFVRPVDLDPDSVLGRFYAVTDHVPTELVVVQYDDNGRVRHASTSSPGGQSAITGQHVNFTPTPSTGRRAAVLRILAAGVTEVTP